MELRIPFLSSELLREKESECVETRMKDILIRISSGQWSEGNGWQSRALVTFNRDVDVPSANREVESEKSSLPSIFSQKCAFV